MSVLYDVTVCAPDGALKLIRKGLTFAQARKLSLEHQGQEVYCVPLPFPDRPLWLCDGRPINGPARMLPPSEDVPKG